MVAWATQVCGDGVRARVGEAWRGLSGSGAARLVAATIMVAHARERGEEVSEEETMPWTT